MSAAGSSTHSKRTRSARSETPERHQSPFGEYKRHSEGSATPPFAPPKKRTRRGKGEVGTTVGNSLSSPPTTSRVSPPTAEEAEPVNGHPSRQKYADHQYLKERKPRHRHHPKSKFTPGRPTQEYLDKAYKPSERSDPQKLVTQFTKSKLLILDLNGTLLFRKRMLNSSTKVPYPRPYIPTFLSWIFHPENALETMIWSSAQPENVHKMVDTCFGETYTPSLKVIWARDTLGLSKAQYNQKVQTVKNLDVIWSHFPYSVQNTLLIDDSPLKAHMQPWNHLVLREYDEELFHRRNDPESPKDETLLAVIGVLSEANRQSNVAHWIREGGLMKPPTDMNANATASTVPAESPKVEMNNVESSPPTTPSKGKGKERASSTPPSSPTHSRSVTSSPILPTTTDGLLQSEADQLAEKETAWFHDQSIVHAWVRIGRAELERLGIPVEVGPINGRDEAQ